METDSSDEKSGQKDDKAGYHMVEKNPGVQIACAQYKVSPKLHEDASSIAAEVGTAMDFNTPQDTENTALKPFRNEAAEKLKTGSGNTDDLNFNTLNTESTSL